MRLVLLDVDGVLTDGTVLMHGDGTESKPFHIRDGGGDRVDVEVRGDGRAAVRERVGLDDPARGAARDPIVSQGVASKQAEYARIIARVRGVGQQTWRTWATTCSTSRCFAASVWRPCPRTRRKEVRARAHWVSRRPGGRGAVRELLEMI